MSNLAALEDDDVDPETPAESGPVPDLTTQQLEWIETHLEKAHAAARRYCRIGGGLYRLDELRSAAYLGLIRAARSYDPSFGASFYTHAFHHMDAELRRVHRRQLLAIGFANNPTKGERLENLARGRSEYAMPRRVRIQAWPRDQNGREIDLHIPVPDTTEDTVDVARMRALALSCASGTRALRILSMRFAGNSYRAIGAQVGVSYERVRQIVRDETVGIRRKLRATHPELIAREDEVMNKRTVQDDPTLALVQGVYMDRSVRDFQNACAVHILDEKRKASPDSALIGLLCDAVRCSRELVKVAGVRWDAPTLDELRVKGLEADQHKARADRVALIVTDRDSEIAERVRCSEIDAKHLRRLTTERDDALAALRPFADLKNCDEEPTLCQSDSGPYCQAHGFEFLLSGEVKAARAVLERVGYV